MDVEYVLGPDDFMAFQRYAWTNLPRKSLPRQGLITWIVLGILGLISLHSLFLLTQGERSVFLIAVPCSFLCYLSFLIFRRKVALLQARWNLKRGLYDDFLGWQRLSISPEGLINEDKRATQIVRWGIVKRIGVTEEHAFFFISDAQAYVLPRRPFASEWEFTGFVETARRYRKEAADLPPEKAPRPRKQLPEGETGITAAERDDR
jgi:hypothetical protein